MRDADGPAGGVPASAPREVERSSLERVRAPAPLVRRRLPSGRGATEQPNNTDEGTAPLTGRFRLALLLTGIGTGLIGAFMMVVLFGFEHLAFGSGPGDFQSHVERASAAHRVASLAIAGAFAGPAWYLLRRFTKGERSEVDEAIWAGDGTLSARRSLLSGVISEIVIGMGASIARESAPKLMGGVSGSVTAGWFKLSTDQRRLLVACGAGRRTRRRLQRAARGRPVHRRGSRRENQPARSPSRCGLQLHRHGRRLGLPAAARDLRRHPGLPVLQLDPRVALVAGPVIGLLASGYIRMIGWVSHHRVRGRAAIVTPLVAFSILGAIGVAYPALFGNGKDMAHRAFLGQGDIFLLLALFALKPLVTALCLGSGASGGLFTPFISTGAIFGAMVGIGWSSLWPGSPVGAFALVGAAAIARLVDPGTLGRLGARARAHLQRVLAHGPGDGRDLPCHHRGPARRRLLHLFGAPACARVRSDGQVIGSPPAARQSSGRRRGGAADRRSPAGSPRSGTGPPSGREPAPVPRGLRTLAT
jgi:CIC family chloride channel protein